jgi:transcriptional regulator with XRE-family HTH domain
MWSNDTLLLIINEVVSVLASELREHFGQRLYFLRRLRDLTQEELAEAIGRSTTFVRAMERGREGPSFNTLAKLAEVLDVDVIELFRFNKSLPQ